MTSKEKVLDPVDVHDREETFDDASHDHGESANFLHANWRFKTIAFITAMMLSAGGHFSSSAISAMKSTVKSQLDIDNTRYGVLSSSVSIINTLIPIAGGTFVDTFGSVWGTLSANGMIVLGSILTAIAAKHSSFAVMVIGRIVFGIGSGVIVTMQESILSKWFRTRQLALVIGIQLSVGRLAAFLGTLVSNPVVERTGDWVWAFWLSMICCLFSATMNVIYAGVVKFLDQQQQQQQQQHGTAIVPPSSSSPNQPQRQQQPQRRRLFHWQSVMKFPVTFWLITLIECIHSSVWTSFHTVSTEFVQMRFHTTTVEAGYKSSMAQIVPVVVAPVLGVLMDRAGGRMVILFLNSVFLILSTLLLGWTWADAVVGMICYSVSLAMGPVAMITSIGMILPPSYIGTGLGMYKSANNAGAVIMDIAVGVIQDQTMHQAYTGVMLAFLVLSSLGALGGVVLWWVQRRWYHDLLNCRKSVRMARMAWISEQEHVVAQQGLDHYAATPLTWMSCLCATGFGATLLVAWILFFVYALSGHAEA